MFVLIRGGEKKHVTLLQGSRWDHGGDGGDGAGERFPRTPMDLK